MSKLRLRLLASPLISLWFSSPCTSRLFSLPFLILSPSQMNVLSDKPFHSLVNLLSALSDSHHGAKVPTLRRKCTLWTWPACLFGSTTADFTRQKYLERMMARDRETPVGYDFGHSVNTFTVTSCKNPGAWKRSSLETVKHINCSNQLRWICWPMCH